MAITAVYATGATGGGTGSNYTLTPPDSSAQAGDVAVIVAAERMSSESITGITDTATGTLAFTSLRFSAPSTVAATSIWYRVLLAGDPGVGNTNTWTVATTRGGEAVLEAYRGVDNVNPIDAQGTTNTATSASATFNSVTTVTDGAMFIGAFAQSNAAGGLVSQTSGSPTLTIRGNNGNGGATTTKEAVGSIDGIITTAGASGAYVWSVTSAAWSTDTFALRPSVAVAATGAAPTSLQIPNRYVGPMALRQAFRRANFSTPASVTLSDFTGASTSTDITVGLTAAGAVGISSDSTSTDITVGLSAAGAVGISGDSTSTDVTVGLTADGSVDAGIAAPQLILPNRNVGPMALRQAFRRAQPTVVDTDNFRGTASTDITVGTTAAGFVAISSGSTSTDITVGTTAAGVVGTSGGSTSTGITVGTTATGVVGASSGSTATAITVGTTADGVVGTTSGSTSTDVTVGLTAAGSIDEIHPAPPLRIPNRNVGPMALRAQFRQVPTQYPDLTVAVGDFTGTSTSTDITVGTTAAGVVGTVSGSTSTDITVGVSAAGVVGKVSGAGSTDITVGLTAAGVAGTSSGSASTNITVGLSADGIVGTVASATSTDITVGLTADGFIATTEPTPTFQIPNRYVGPMALRQAFRRPQAWTAETVLAGQPLSLTGIDTSQTFGNPTADQVPSPAAVNSAEALGSVTVIPGAVNVAPASVALGDGVGIATVVQIGSPVGISSSEAIGNATATQVVSPVGAESLQALGVPTFTLFVTPASVGSGQAFGNVALVFGAVSPASIAPTDALGAPTLTLSVSPTSIGSGQALGNITAGQQLVPTGIASGEIFGAPALILTLTPVGVASGETFGSPVVAPGPVNIAPASVITFERLGNAVAIPGTVTITPVGLATGELFGQVTMGVGPVSIVPASIAGLERFGISTVVFTVNPAGIGTREVFGSPLIVPGPVSVTPTGILPGDRFGNTAIAMVISQASIISAEIFGDGTVAATVITSGDRIYRVKFDPRNDVGSAADQPDHIGASANILSINDLRVYLVPAEDRG